MDQRVLEAMRERVCAIGLIVTPLDQVVAAPREMRFKIFGTGFALGPNVALTNRHVIYNLRAYREQQRLPLETRYVSFIRRNGRDITVDYREIDRFLLMTKPKPMDVGLVYFQEHEELAKISAVQFLPEFTASVGDPIAVYGYPYGEKLLRRDVGADDDEQYRFGPILQQGYISAIAPWDHSARVDRVLLDVRTANGMSGSPVFDPVTGSVLALHDAGFGTSAVAFGIPLSTGLIDALLQHPRPPLGEEFTSMAPYVVRSMKRERGS